MMSFEELSRYAPNLEVLRRDNEGGQFTTTFWEDLYQTFKARMIAESNDEPRS